MTITINAVLSRYFLRRFRFERVTRHFAYVFLVEWSKNCYWRLQQTCWTMLSANQQQSWVKREDFHGSRQNHPSLGLRQGVGGFVSWRVLECRVVDGRVIISRVYRGAKLRGIVTVNLQRNTLTIQTKFLLRYAHSNTSAYEDLISLHWI